MTYKIDIASLSPQEKLALIQKLKQEKKITEKTHVNQPLILHEHRSLLDLIATGQLQKLNAATLAYLPIQNKSISEKIKTIFKQLPILFNIFEFSFGSTAIIILPIDENDLFNHKLLLKAQLEKGLHLANFIGAKSISLAGLIPSVTQYGTDIISLIPQKSTMEITTGHATTTATVIITLKELLKNQNKTIQNEIIGFVGIGSIGQSSLKLMLNTLPHPKELILCDIPAVKILFDTLKTEIRQLGFKNKIKFIESAHQVPKEFYQSTIIIGATNQANVLDINQLKPGTILIDDSIPHCFDANKAYERMQSQKDIICIEAGMINSPEPIKETRYLPDEIKPFLSYLPKIILNRLSCEMTSCILAGLLTSTHANIKASTGIQNHESAKIHYNTLMKMNFHAPKLRINGQNIPSDIKL